MYPSEHRCFYFTGCGGLFQLAHGQKTEIKSLNYGSLRNYPPNSDCRWLFMADNNTEFDVIVQKLNFELCCHCDYLRIYQGMQSKSNVLYEICTKPIQDYLIKGGMVLHFHSDYSLQAKGFLIDINAWKGVLYCNVLFFFSLFLITLVYTDLLPMTLVYVDLLPMTLVYVGLQIRAKFLLEINKGEKSFTKRLGFPRKGS